MSKLVAQLVEFYWPSLVITIPIVLLTIATGIYRWSGSKRVDTVAQLCEATWMTPLYVWGLNTLLVLTAIGDGTTNYYIGGHFYERVRQFSVTCFYALAIVVVLQIVILTIATGWHSIRAHFRGTLGWSALFTVGGVLLLVEWYFISASYSLGWTVQPGQFLR